MVWGKSGKSQFFPFEKLDHVLDGERIFVAMFADQGVTIPKDTFVRGDAEQFGPFLKARINKKLRIETKKKKMKGWYRLSSSRELVPSKGTSGENRAVCCEKSGMANPRAFKVRLRAAGAEPSRSRWHRCC